MQQLTQKLNENVTGYAMHPNKKNQAILFADISGSTRLYETLGDVTASNSVTKCLKNLASIVESNSGKVIKTIGDEIMCTFSSAEDAASASCEMHESMENFEFDDVDNDVPLQIRVGIHYGPTLVEGGDIYGDAVNVAARMVTQAKGGQIITTQHTADLLSPVMRANSRFVDRTPVKGKKDEINIFEIIWQHDDITGVPTGAEFSPDKTIKETKLKLNYKGQEVELNDSRPNVELGRSKNCDLSIQGKLVSRQHVRIERRRDKYFIIDQSTNGTHVLLKDNSKLFLRREERLLKCNGEISFGQPFNENPDDVVSFSLENQTPNTLKE